MEVLGGHKNQHFRNHDSFPHLRTIEFLICNSLVCLAGSILIQFFIKYLESDDKNEKNNDKLYIDIIMRMYNDWDSLNILIPKIHNVLKNLNKDVSIIIINDASTESIPDFSINLDKINSIKLITMKQNR